MNGNPRSADGSQYNNKESNACSPYFSLGSYAIKIEFLLEYDVFLSVPTEITKTAISITMILLTTVKTSVIYCKSTKNGMQQNLVNLARTVFSIN